MNDSLVISYLTLRRLVGVLGIAISPVLIIGAGLEHSISAYYHTGMRDVFVGILCGISLFLFSYNGYSWKDSMASRMAGVFALGIAFFPTNDDGNLVGVLHYLCAGAFFLILSYMSGFLFTKSSGELTPQKITRNHIYMTCALIMVLCVITVPIVRDYILWLETVALLAFGFSWLVKGEFLLKDK